MYETSILMRSQWKSLAPQSMWMTLIGERWKSTNQTWASIGRRASFPRRLSIVQIHRLKAVLSWTIQVQMMERNPFYSNIIRENTYLTRRYRLKGRWATRAHSSRVSDLFSLLMINESESRRALSITLISMPIIKSKSKSYRQIGSHNFLQGQSMNMRRGWNKKTNILRAIKCKTLNSSSRLEPHRRKLTEN